MKGFNKILKQAQQMANQLKKLEEELAKMTVETSVGGGMVKAVANGEGQLLKIEINPEVINPEDKEMLEDLIISAVNDVMRKAKELSKEEMSKITGGLNIPGLF